MVKVKMGGKKGTGKNRKISEIKCIQKINKADKLLMKKEREI